MPKMIILKIETDGSNAQRVKLQTKEKLGSTRTQLTEWLLTTPITFQYPIHQG